MQLSKTKRKSPAAAPERLACTGPRVLVVLQFATVRVTAVVPASLTTTVPNSAADGLMVSGPVAVPVRFWLAEPLLPPLAAIVAVLAPVAVP